MSRNADILFVTEYIKNVFYFATVRPGKVLRSTEDIHYFSIDNELVYENYYSDFGPLNLGCVFRYCRLLNEKLKQYLNKQTIIHYTSIDHKKKANAAFLVGCYGVLYLKLQPKDALKPLTVHGQTYRPFQDATQGDSMFTISLLDCLQAIKKAREMGFFNFPDFDYDEYERLDKIQGGDLNWIVPGKFLAFIGPVDYSISLYHPPEMYIEYFKENNVKVVIRLNKRMYDGNIFNNAGVLHYDLYFPDGSTPPRHILQKFLQISEEVDGAIAVHCKAGLGRTGSLIGSYLIKHYRMTAREAIGWMRICRPGSVIGHQQGWLEQLEPWLIKQGNLYRKRTFQDTEKFPIHEFGVYSIAEKIKQMPIVLNSRPASPPPPLQRKIRSDVTQQRPQASRVRDATCKTSEKKSDWNVRNCKMNTNQLCPSSRGDISEAPTVRRVIRRTNGAGEPRVQQNMTQISPPVSTRTPISQKSRESKQPNDLSQKIYDVYPPLPSYGTNQASTLKSLNDARHFLRMSSIFNYPDKRETTPIHTYPSITPQRPFRSGNLPSSPVIGRRPTTRLISDTRDNPVAGPQRRRLGRSPSPSPATSPTRLTDHTRTPNTAMDKYNYVMQESKATLRQAFSRLKLAGRNASACAPSVGAASLGARREAPADAPRRAPTVRSDERPIATQGDMLNSIKFQRRYKETLTNDKISTMLNKKMNSFLAPKRNETKDGSSFSKHPTPVPVPRSIIPPSTRERPITKQNVPQRPTSPKGRMRTAPNAFM